MATLQRTVSAILLICSLAVLLLLVVAWARPPKVEKDQGVGQRFHDATSLGRAKLNAEGLGPRPPRPPLYKTYPDAKRISLPKANYRGVALEDAIIKRRSVREYANEPLSLKQVSQLLFAAQGITAEDGPYRAAPSGGALYPFEIYIIAHNIEGLPAGLYHYAVREHALEQIKTGEFRDEITRAGLGQECLGDAGATFVLTAIFDRSRSKYGDRGFRYVYMEAGHISQNICLQAVSLELGSVTVGAFFDDQVNQLLDADGEHEAVIYLQPVGRLAGR